MNYLNLNTDKKTTKRPDLLTVLCILTFIGSGIGAFSSFFISLSYNEAITFWEETEFNIPEMEIIMSGGKGFFVTGFIFYTVALFGAIQMWKLKKIGFHLYTVAQILLLILPVTYIKSYDFSYIELLLTGAFIIAYSTNLKYMA